LNGVVTVILRYSPNSTAFRADYITVVEVRPMLSPLWTVNRCQLVAF